VIAVILCLPDLSTRLPFCRFGQLDKERLSKGTIAVITSQDSVSSTAQHDNPLVVKRDGQLSQFAPDRIKAAIEKAFRAELGVPTPASLPDETLRLIENLSTQVCSICSKHSQISVEKIQDEVERTLMLAGQHAIARRYVLYREERARLREGQTLHFAREDGSLVKLDSDWMSQWIAPAFAGLGEKISFSDVSKQLIASIFPGIAEREVHFAAILATRALIERQPNYSFAAARLLLGRLYSEVTGSDAAFTDSSEIYRQYSASYFQRAIDEGLLSPELGEFDIHRITAALIPERDLQFSYLGLQTLYDRYFLQSDGVRIELPQLFWMRVAMGLAINETNKEERATEYYNLLSEFRFTSATPTLFNSGSPHPQLSSCYLTTISDDLGAIFKSIRDNALLSKWAGGLGNDWTNIRALGSHIRGTNGNSQGIIPFLKVANDAAIAVNQGGKRKGAVCAYLEIWHLDIEEFLDLRKNTGDERRRAHDMNTANWIPDLFMKRVREGGEWTLFSPNDVPDLHELYGKEFEERYVHYEKLAESGVIRLHKRLHAVDLWRRMLTSLFETGHPWITWKDPSNTRSTQDHAGVIHNSNLCTEILLNTSPAETAVCNLGSVNLAAHIRNGKLDYDMMRQTVRIAMRMLDNVIDINYYPTPEAQEANLHHRPVGLGIMGFQDALCECAISYASDDAMEFADRSMEALSYFAIESSIDLAKERGAYSSFAGSKWSRGLMPIDTIDEMENQRGAVVKMDKTATLDWDTLRKSVVRYGIRNSNILAIAPTATISNIVGVSQSIEPTYKNLYVKSNLSGDFIQINARLVKDLERLGLWDDKMLDDLKYYDGSLLDIERIPDPVKQRYLTAFEIDPSWLIECASRRQKWIDMGQSLNLYMEQPSGRKLSDMYFLAWEKGLKTTYYLRTLAATHVEKSTIDINRRGIQPRWMKNSSASAQIAVSRDVSSACNLGDECEACQ
jgi:ribonucleoside-diphosphate reductase alpha chain